MFIQPRPKKKKRSHVILIMITHQRVLERSFHELQWIITNSRSHSFDDIRHHHEKCLFDIDPWKTRTRYSNPILPRIQRPIISLGECVLYIVSFYRPFDLLSMIIVLRNVPSLTKSPVIVPSVRVIQILDTLPLVSLSNNDTCF